MAHRIVFAALRRLAEVRLTASGQSCSRTRRAVRVIGTLHVGEIKESEIIYAIYSIPDAVAR